MPITRFAATTVAIAAALAAGQAAAQATPSLEGTTVYFVNLEDGDTVSGPVTIIFGLDGMGIAPAGVEWPDTGHHHILLNRAPFLESELGDEELELNIPADENHRHFGGGQTQTTLELEPGEHTLQLVLGDHDHIPHDPPIYSERITITVE